MKTDTPVSPATPAASRSGRRPRRNRPDSASSAKSTDSPSSGSVADQDTPMVDAPLDYPLERILPITLNAAAPAAAPTAAQLKRSQLTRSFHSANPPPVDAQWDEFGAIRSGDGLVSATLSESSSRHPAVTSLDSKYIFQLSRLNVTVLRSEGAQFLRILPYVGPDDPAVTLAPTGDAVAAARSHSCPTVLAAFPCQENPMRLYTVYSNGLVYLWDYLDGSLLRKYDTGVNLLHAQLCSVAGANTFILVTGYRNPLDAETQVSSVLAVSFEAQTVITLGTLPAVGVVTSVFSPGFGFCMVHSSQKRGRHQLHFSIVPHKSLEALGTGKATLRLLQSFPAQSRVVSLAISLATQSFAAGLDSGKIAVFRSRRGAFLAPEMLHWHSSAVRALCFSNDGLLLLSGGREGVLTLWQLGSRSRSFLAHLDSPIQTIGASADLAFYMVGLRDSTLHRVDASSNQVADSFIGVRRPEALDTPLAFANGIPVDPITKGAVFRSVPGRLQFFSFKQGRHIRELDITGRNVELNRERDARHSALRAARISGRTSLALAHTVRFPSETAAGDMVYLGNRRPTELSFTSDLLDLVSFSPDGHWMGTVDSVQHRRFATLTTLRFWRYCKETKRYLLSTKIEMPHKVKVTSLNFHPNSRLCVTTGMDRRFRLWQLTEDPSSTASEEDGSEGAAALPSSLPSWVSLSSGYFRDNPCMDSAFSSDGSVLAVASGSYLTVWNPFTNTLRGHVLTSPHELPILDLRFLPGSPYVVIRTASSVHVWDLLSFKMKWSLPIVAEFLAVHPTRPVFMLCPVDRRLEEVYAWWMGGPLGTDNFGKQLLLFGPESQFPICRKLVAGAEITAATFFDDSLQFCYVDRIRCVHYATLDKDVASILQVSPAYQVASAIAGAASAGLSGEESDAAAAGGLPRLPGAAHQRIAGADGGRLRAASATGAASALPPVAGAARDALLATPAHILPAPAVLFGQFFQEVILPLYNRPGSVKDGAAAAAAAAATPSSAEGVAASSGASAAAAEEGAASMPVAPAAAPAGRKPSAPLSVPMLATPASTWDNPLAAIAAAAGSVGIAAAASEGTMDFSFLKARLPAATAPTTGPAAGDAAPARGYIPFKL
ncbi:hypothetical protein H696_05041 [Fonticula alba]|uniref:WD repeat-containing protein 75 second beta-propeller domain-containing protein n=1 Tax=Fonticula alba TaxID=691883 RepID=A0A058Z5E4_FONAL|nr:hypothetical protein H696_05041 [Fonticula alba]KCV68757.1 hypothetical protein H696_05041 [Fonticula alba]|eukprot:XP_009497189.1 hypothetical protein H696_05041 [Fonticula alba]